MVLEAANGFLLDSASSLVCRGGISGLASCAPLIWTSQEPYSGIFTMPLEKEISFSFIFSLGRSNLQPVSYDFLPHSSCYLPRTWLEYLRGAAREVAVVHSQSQQTVLHHSICSTAVQYLPAGRYHTVLCSSLLVGRETSPPGAAGLDGGAAGNSCQHSVLPGRPSVISVRNVSGRGLWANTCSLQERSLPDPSGFFSHVSPYILMCLLLLRAWSSEQDQHHPHAQVCMGR